jgi:hypothetical protein
MNATRLSSTTQDEAPRAPGARCAGLELLVAFASDLATLGASDHEALNGDRVDGPAGDAAADAENALTPLTSSTTRPAARGLSGPPGGYGESVRSAGLSYLLPLRACDDSGLAELTDYLRTLSSHCEVVVVDGSPPHLARRHRAAWSGLARIVPPDPDVLCRNGKARGVITGMRRVQHERVIIADDDVRYDEPALARTARLLGEADLVRPQNYFDPLPWHARWDTARSLLNRGFAADYPGTLAVRRSRFEAMGGYNGDVLFENLELIRTVRASGGRVVSPRDLFVRRLPPTTGHFLGQRIRQAYDDLAQPARLAVFLSIGPLLVLSRRRRALAGAAAAASMVAAEAGRRRGGGASVFPPSASLLAPVWLVERAMCSWLAVGARFLSGGIPYAGSAMRDAATPARRLRRRFAAGCELQVVP